MDDVPSEDTRLRLDRGHIRARHQAPAYRPTSGAEQFCAERFGEIGLEGVWLEPLTVARWEPLEWGRWR